MEARCRSSLTSLLTVASLCCNAADPADCDRERVDAHVRDQIQVYGPRSVKYEHFAFIYRHEGVIASAVIQGRVCRDAYSCSVHTESSAKLIPRGAKVLGEWHTHPHQGSATLSIDDVRGAHNNRHIRCYAAYYAKPNGDILAWDPQKDTVPSAMYSRVSIGKYGAVPASGTAGADVVSRHASAGSRPASHM